MKKFLLVFSLAVSSLFASIDHSIIPFLDKLENAENLSPKKYTSTQYQEILSSLKYLDQKIRIVSYNMLFDLYDAKLDPENRWPIRFPRIVSAVDSFEADILCVQELQEHQLIALEKKLSKDFLFVFDIKSLADIEKGFSKDFDGIFYRKSRFLVLEEKTFSIVRNKKKTNVTMVLLEDRKTKKTIRVFNSHFPFSECDAREYVAKEITKILLPYTEKEAVVLTGDLNTFANRPDLQRLPFYDGDYIESLLEKGKIFDSIKKSALGHIGPLSTFTNLGEDPTAFKGFGTPGIVLDHIYVSDSVKTIIHATDPVQIDGLFPSDHMPVVADVYLP